MSLITSPLVDTNTIGTIGVIDTIEEFKLRYDNTDKFIEDNKLSEDVLEYYVNNYEANWWYISAFQTLSESFIEKYSGKMIWYAISVYQTLSEQFIDKYSDKVDWWCISRCQTLSEAFIEKYIDKVDWCNISYYQTLSESFIEKYIDKVDWGEISIHQTLSESFIDKYMDKMDWFDLITNEKITLSYNFLVLHLYKFNLYELWISIEKNDNVDRLIKEFNYKYEIDKIAYEFNKRY